MLVAIDAEFVSVSRAEACISAGQEVQLKPSRCVQPTHATAEAILLPTCDECSCCEAVGDEHHTHMLNVCMEVLCKVQLSFCAVVPC